MTDKVKTVLLITSALINVVLLGALMTDTSGNVEKQPQQSQAVTEEKPSAPTTTISEGIFKVNTEVKPGTYKTTADDGCYFARLKGFSGDAGEIIANGVKSSGEQAIVTIEKTDVGFDSSNCGTWKLVD